MTTLRLGISRARLGPAAAMIDPVRGLAACEENRLTRARQAPLSGPPELAIAELLQYLNRTPGDIGEVGVVPDDGDRSDSWHGHAAGPGATVYDVPAHDAHAEYAFSASGFPEALVVVCDDSTPHGWTAYVTRAANPIADAPPAAPAFLHEVGRFPIARIYALLTEALGLRPARDEHLVEAMARAGDARADAIADLIRLTEEGIDVAPEFQQVIHEAASGDDARRHVAAVVQRRLGECLNELLRRLARQSGARNLCLSGGLFFNTHFTTTAAHGGQFDRTYVPAHPGRVGCAVGAARPRGVGASIGTPYLGPGYTDVAIKRALENCKLSYDLQREQQVIDTVLQAVSRGRLVGWFHGRLEWGPRALGHRTVLADPFAPHVLENLNGYLKQRAWYRSYGVSVPADRLQDFFEVAGAPGVPPSASPFMQYEYRPRDLDTFRTILPPGVQTVRVHTVDEREPRYLKLLSQWGERSGTPVLVNTSFNGFHEPLVCSPRDAIRVFYGTGLDLLALEDFVLRK